jgi:diaminopimelate decarboxylase
MTIERDIERDPDATVKMPAIEDDKNLEDIDPEKTLVREDWESAVIRRVAPHVEAVQSEVGDEGDDDQRFGWETAVLRRLSLEVSRDK